jgi:hypothetical protein
VHYADDPLQHFSWCPTFTVGKDGCVPGLTQVAPSASATANPICLPLPQVSSLVGEGQPSCIVLLLPCHTLPYTASPTVAGAAKPAVHVLHVLCYIMICA